MRRKRAVLICRCGAMGDVVCTLPLCHALREKYPDKLIVFITSAVYRNLVLLSGEADVVYGSKIWGWPFVMPSGFNVLGLVAAVYCHNIGEGSAETVTKLHLVDHLASSWSDITILNRQPRLYPSAELIVKTREKYDLSENKIGKRRLIAINGGPTWPVRMWETSKWQSLINHIHLEYDVVILLLGQNHSFKKSDLEDLKGVNSLFNQLTPEEIVALISICDLVVAIDSGPVHIAGAVRTPVVGLFGALNPQSRLPPDSPSIGLASDIPCRFCQHKTPILHWKEGCPYDIECMKQLDEEAVFAAVKSMLSYHRKRKSDSIVGLEI
jgi:ADP-heptose:LPS heptosyltransferase